ncbi:MAG: DUF2191 domain-containing protein [Nanoarchaeota archaeon]|nr:DUF2191 domain-containing protein [Nanoarchaeota archaeon]
MKVTAILPDKLINDVKKLSHAKNITESLNIALKEWVNIQNLKKLNYSVKENPLVFNNSAIEIREINRAK